MSSTTYSADLNDIRFALFDQHRVHEKMGALAPYAELDREIYEATLEEARRIAEEVLAPINRVGDREGCKLDSEGNVTTPTGNPEAWKVMAEGGWIGTTAPVEHGGGGLPFAIATSISEMFCGSMVILSCTAQFSQT